MSFGREICYGSRDHRAVDGDRGRGYSHRGPLQRQRERLGRWQRPRPEPLLPHLARTVRVSAARRARLSSWAVIPDTSTTALTVNSHPNSRGRAMVPAGEQQDQSNLIKGFYNANRLLNEDAFWVAV